VKTAVATSSGRSVGSRCCFDCEYGHVVLCGLVGFELGEEAVGQREAAVEIEVGVS
jgi:hypothetical protein